MRSLRILSSLSAILVLFRGASALVARGQLPPTSSTSSFAGSATDYPDLTRDGGGGGIVNGINVVSQLPIVSLFRVWEMSELGVKFGAVFALDFISFMMLKE